MYDSRAFTIFTGTFEPQSIQSIPSPPEEIIPYPLAIGMLETPTNQKRADLRCVQPEHIALSLVCCYLEIPKTF
jgi:hypothetical protein